MRTSADDKVKVWEGCPFHIAHQLLLLKEWRIDFDPITESLAKVDVWIRFPGHPVKFVSNQVLATLVEENQLGTVLKIDAFNIYGARKRYPRVCVAMDLAKLSDRKIFVLTEKEEVLTFPIWFEDFSVGCGSCGSPNHVFDECQSRRQFLKQPGAPAMGSDSKDRSQEADGVEGSSKSEWVKIASKKPKDEASLLIGHSKQEVFKFFGANLEIDSPFGSDNDKEILDYETEQEVDGCDETMLEVSQEFFDAVLRDIPPMSEFLLPDLSNPSKLLKSIESVPRVHEPSSSVV